MNYKEIINELYPNVEEIHDIDSGASKSTFKVKIDGEYYILKLNIPNKYLYQEISPLLKPLGILTPETVEIKIHNDMACMLMEYIDGGNLSKDIKEDSFDRLALMMKAMHEIKGSGFGEIHPGTMEGEFKTFPEYINKQFLRKVDVAQEHLPYHYNIIEEYLEANPETVFCHMDFSSNNVLVRDDNYYLIDYGNEAGFNSPLMDIAKSIINDSRFGIKVYEAYDNVFKFDKKALESFLFIVALRKIVSWKKRGKDDRVGLLFDLFRQIGCSEEYIEHLSF